MEYNDRIDKILFLSNWQIKKQLFYIRSYKLFSGVKF